MTARVTIRPGTRDHDVSIAGRTVGFREQKRAHGAAMLLVASGAADEVVLVEERS